MKTIQTIKHDHPFISYNQKPRARGIFKNKQSIYTIHDQNVKDTKQSQKNAFPSIIAQYKSDPFLIFPIKNQSYSDIFFYRAARFRIFPAQISYFSYFSHHKLRKCQGKPALFKCPALSFFGYHGYDRLSKGLEFGIAKKRGIISIPFSVKMYIMP